MMVPFRVGLMLVLVGAASGCNLEFVDVDLEDHARFSAEVRTISDSDSIRIRASLTTGLDRSGKGRRVLSDFLIDGVSLTPTVSTEHEWGWNVAVPITMAAEGDLVLTPPRLEGLANPRQVHVPIPVRIGVREKSVAAGQPIDLPFGFAPAPPLAKWEVHLTTQDRRPLYFAGSQIFPPGPVLIHQDVLPAAETGPFEIRMSFTGRVRDEPDQGRYLVAINLLGELTWIVHRE